MRTLHLGVAAAACLAFVLACGGVIELPDTDTDGSAEVDPKIELPDGEIPPMFALPPPVEVPTDALVVREQCFAGLPRPASRPVPPPSPRPTPTRPYSKSERASKSLSDDAARKPMKGAPEPMAAEAPDPAPPPSAAPAPAPPAGSASAPAPADRTPPPMLPEPPPPAASEIAPAPAAATAEVEAADVEEDEDRAAEVAPPRSGLEWGATVYLSNDDSMSLASAQRVLWAAQAGKKLRPNEIRPHELMNYFHFDTPEVPRWAMFGVQATARRTAADTLSLAVAVQGASPPRLSLDATLVIDRSGSMREEGRMSFVKRGLSQMVGHLQGGDRVDLVFFDHQVCTAVENFVVGRDDLAELTSAIDRLAPRGATDIGKALDAAYALAASRPTDPTRRNQRVVLLTDAWITRGDIRPETFARVGEAFDAHAIRLTGVGVGKTFNDDVLDALTEKGKGSYVYLGSEAVVDRVFDKQGVESLTRTIAHDVHFALDLPDSLAMERFYGEESSTRKEDVQPVNYYAGTSQVFLQDLALGSRGIVDADEIVFTITYDDSRDGKPRTQTTTLKVGDVVTADAHNLYKARALISWSDLLLAQALGDDPCGEPLNVWRQRSQDAWGDVEIGYVYQLVAKTCGVPNPSELVQYKVNVDSDAPIPEVELTCDRFRMTTPLPGGGRVAQFHAPHGVCKVRLPDGREAEVRVPESGGDTRCIARGDQLSCR